MTMEEAVNNARQRREQLQQQEDDAAKRMHAYLDAILKPLAALYPIQDDEAPEGPAPREAESPAALQQTPRAPALPRGPAR